MDKKILFVIASQGFQDLEFREPYEILTNAGIEIHIASNQKGECIGAFGAKATAQYTIEEINGKDYDAIVFVGGPGAYSTFNGDDNYLNLAKKAKILAAICIAPTIISDSGLFKGKKVTGWDSGRQQQIYIEQNGGIFTGETVTIDGNIITGNGPGAAKEFGEKIVEMLHKTGMNG